MNKENVMDIGERKLYKSKDLGSDSRLKSLDRQHKSR